MTAIERADIQGNILDGYRYDHALHMFVCFAPGRGKHALYRLIPCVTSAAKWEGQQRPKHTLNLGLTFTGLRALGLPEAWLESFPEAFKDGMQKRAADLGDDETAYHPRGAVHMWLWIHGRDESALAEARALAVRALSDDAAISFEQHGAILRNAQGHQIEHFGFRDAISQPDVLGKLAPLRRGNGVATGDGGWRPLATGEFLLGHVDESGEVATAASPPELCHNATFAVFRQLEQDVAGFRKYLAAQASKLGVSEDWLAERFVGRTQDGVVLGQPQTSSVDQLNDFSYRNDDDGRHCPLGSHIRRTNPRTSQGFIDAFARHRILRRGSAYGKLFDPAEPAQDEARGLFFVALNADIERQFEFIQRLYVNDGAAPRQGHDTDPLAGPSSARFVIPGDPLQPRKTVICSKLPSFVTCRGGDYFILPGLRGLECMQRAASDPASAGWDERAPSSVSDADLLRDKVNP